MPGRIRTVKPEWLDDELMASAGSDARVLSIALMLLADDYGNGRCAINLLASRVFPPSDDSLESLAKSSRTFRESLDKLSKMRFVGLYEVDGQHYFTIRNWTKHQKVDHAGKPLVPGPPEGFWESSREPRETLAPDMDQDQDQDQEAPETKPARAKRSRTVQPKFEMHKDWLPSQERVEAISVKHNLLSEAITRQLPEFRLTWSPGGKCYTPTKGLKRQCDWEQTFSWNIDWLVEHGKLDGFIRQATNGKTNQSQLFDQADDFG